MGQAPAAWAKRLRFACLAILTALALWLPSAGSAEAATLTCPTKTTSSPNYLDVTYYISSSSCVDTPGGLFSTRYDDNTAAFSVSGTTISSASVSGSGVCSTSWSGTNYVVTYTASGTCTVLIALGNSYTVTYSLVNDNTNAIITNMSASVTTPTSPSSTSLASSANPSVYGQSVTFTATVSGSGSTPTGTVTFKDNGVTLGTGNLSGGGTATFTTSALSQGNHNAITADYGGDSSYTTSSGTLAGAQVVNPASTTTTINASAANTVYGESVTLTATVAAVAPGAGTPTGLVTFFDGPSQIGVVSVGVGGVATLNTSILSAAPHNTITASYGGSGSFYGSTSAPTNVTVNRASTSATITSSANPSVSGQSVTFTSTVAAVAPGAGQPTGSVSFYAGLTLIGTGNLSNGTTSVTTSSLPAGASNIQARYSGDANFASANSVFLSQAVNPASTVTTISLTPNPTAYADIVTFTVTVAAVAPGAGTPTGVVMFAYPGSPSSPLTLTGGSVGGSTASLPVGVTNFSATYVGDANFSGSTGSANQTVNQANQTITFNQPATQTFGTAPTLTATATSNLSVTFTSATTGVCTITSGGVLTFVTAGTCTINADQAGDSSYIAAAQVSRSFTVAAVAPGAPSIGTATAGDTQASVTFSAPASTGGASITSYTATSSPGGLTGTGATSPITVTGLTNGTAYTFTVTATNSVGTGAASAASNAVTPAGAQTITFNNPGAQNFGTTPTLTATASSGLSVTFTSGTTGVCTITSGGALTFVTAGTCTIYADQAGNANFTAAMQVARSFSVNPVVPAAPTIGTATAGDTQAFVAFTPPAATGGAAVTGYTATANPGGLTGTGASSPITVSGLTNGTAYTFTVTATNSAGTGAASSASNSVTPRSTQTITFANPGAQNFGTSPTLTATASSGLPVTFTSGTTGVCTITSGGALTFVTAGTCTINADQAGNANFTAAMQVAQTFAVNAVAPGAPVIGTATAGAGQASVTFTAPVSTGGASITGYTVTSNPAGVTATGASSPIVVTGLTNGTAYTFTVTATNLAGTGAASAASNSVTPINGQTITFANPGPQVFGTSPQLTASATSNQLVTFTSSTTGVCTVTTGGRLTFVSTGPCSINADQAGGGAYGAAQTVTQAFAVVAASQTVAFTSTAPGGATVGGATYTPSATASSGLPAAISVDASSASVCAISGGVVSFTSGGTCVLNADQAGNGNYLPAPRVQQAFAVQIGSSSVALGASSAAPAFGAPVTFTATVTPGAATGTVTFKDGGVTLGTGTLSNGVAAFTTSALAAGAHSITAVYGGDAAYATSTSAVVTVTVQQGVTTTGLAASSTNPVYGANVTFTATVAPNAASGIVEFREGGAPIGQATLANGSASLSTASLSAGAHQVVAVYLGDASYATSTSAAVTVTVQRVTTTTALAVSSATPAMGASVTFTATLQPAAASGVVAFFDGATQIGTATIANGAAAFSTSSLTAGAHQITASYAGDAIHAPSVSAARLVTVGDPLVIVTTSLATPMLGQPYAQAIVTSGGLQPVTCSLGAGQLPQGLTLNAGTCAIAGTPSAGVTFAFTIVARDAAAATASRAYSGRINRPDPGQDATVRGLVAAQTAQTLRFARGQSGMVQQRLERLHDEGDECASSGASVCVTFDNGISVTQAEAPRSREADAREVFDAVRSGRVIGEPLASSRQASAEKRMERAMNSRFEAQDGALASTSQPASPEATKAGSVYGALPDSIETRAADPSRTPSSRKGPAFTPLTLNMWTAGAIQIGRYSQQQQSFGAKIDDKFRTTGLAFGVDTRLMPGLKAGLALGFGADNAEVGNDGSRSRASNVSVTLYASQKIGSSLFLDGLVGYGAMRFDTRRLQAASGDWLEGKRRGGFFFESLALTSEHKWNGFKFAPWVGLTAIQATLDPYAESGAPEWALSYARTRMNSVDASAGLRVSYDIAMGWGVLTPIARLQYTRMFGGSMTQEMNYSVDPAMLFTVQDNAQSNWAVNGSLGFLAKGANGVSGGLEATGSTSGSGRRGTGLRGNVRVAF